jgi:hypothetical protein
MCITLELQFGAARPQDIGWGVRSDPHRESVDQAESKFRDLVKFAEVLRNIPTV